MVLPLTILIVAALICLMLTFYTDFLEQTAQHEAERNELYEKREAAFLRMRNAFSALEEVNPD